MRPRTTADQHACPQEWGLTTREREIACILAGGYSYAEIAERLGISRHTVSTHVKAILKKTRFGTSRRLAAALQQHKNTHFE